MRGMRKVARENTELIDGTHGDFIRPATAGDLDFVRGLSNQVFSVFGDYDEMVSHWIANPECVAGVYVKEGSRPLGFVVLSLSIGEILAIAVIPDYQRSGIGSALLHYMEFLATQRGLKMLHLHTAKENEAAQAFFGKAGFQVIDDQSNYYPKGQTALVMSKPI
jgi:ribosomal protein S18 acetylase RimI-like enzyme